MEFYPENLGEDELPLIEAMGVEYTVARVKKMILEVSGHIAETPTGEDDGVTCGALVQLLAFVAAKPLPAGMEPMSDCDRWAAVRTLDRLRKAEATGEDEKRDLSILKFLLLGRECKG